MHVDLGRERAFFLLIALACLATLWPVILPVASGAILGYVSEPALDWLERKTRAKRKRTAWLLATVFVLLTVALFLVPLGIMIYISVMELASLVTGANLTAAVPKLANQLFDFASQRLASYGVHITIADVVSRAEGMVTGLSQRILTQAGNLLSATPEALFDTSIFIFTWVIYMVEGRRYRNRLLPVLIPWQNERNLLRRTTGDVLKATIVANVLVSVVQAVLVVAALAIAGIPKAFLWGTLAFFLSFIPVLGTAPITVGAAIWCFTQGRTGTGIGLLVAAFLVGTADNILRPFFMKGGSELSFFWALLAFVGGLAQFGVSGVVIGPLAFGLFASALAMLESKEPATV